MRAETQSTIEAIRKTLTLLAQRMDWETARHRLEEFDAMIEDPNLWNDPARAQVCLGVALIGDAAGTADLGLA